MSANFIELNEAAEKLGVSTDELNEMRLRGEIYGVRDGASWKFKSSELERVLEERGADESGGSSLDLDDSDEGTSSALDLGGEVADVNAPTAIGSLDDFDEMGLPPAESGPGTADEAESSSDLSLDDSEGESSVDLMEGSGSDLLDSGKELASGGSDELGFEGSDLSLSSEASLDESKSGAPDRGSGAELSIDDDDELALGDDDELVLGGGTGSGDVTGGTGDTGINLTSPSDSGLNLEEEPLDLAGSSVSSLELPEDEEDEILDLEGFDGGSDMNLQADEDFNLTPSGGEAEDEEDSGSQVIALEDSEAFDEEATVLATGEEPGTLDGEAGVTAEGFSGPQDAMAVPASAAPELPYSVYNIVGLVVVALILALAGMLMTDLIRHIWSWDQPYSASTSLMDLMVNVFGLDP